MRQVLLGLRHYETIVAIVEFGTMTEAARHLSTSQSALSHRLAEAERRLGTPLFDRGPQRRLTPNRAGLAVHQAASRALADLGRTEESLIAVERHPEMTLRVGVGSYDCYHWYPGFLDRVRASWPDVDLELSVVGDVPSSALASGAVDLVVAPGEPEGIIDLIPLFFDELVLVVSPEHPLADRDVVTADDLAEETYFTYNASPTPGFEYDRFVRPAERYPQVVRVVPQTSAIIELVAAGAGVAILSRWALTPPIEAGRLVPIRCGDDGLILSWNAALRADERDDMVLAIVDDLSEWLRYSSG